MTEGGRRHETGKSNRTRKWGREPDMYGNSTLREPYEVERLCLQQNIGRSGLVAVCSNGARMDISRLSQIGLLVPVLHGSKALAWSVKRRLKNASMLEGDTRKVAYDLAMLLESGDISLETETPKLVTIRGPVKDYVYYQEYYACARSLFPVKDTAAKVLADVPMVLPLDIVLRWGYIAEQGFTCSFSRNVNHGELKKAYKDDIFNAREQYRRQGHEFAVVGGSENSLNDVPSAQRGCMMCCREIKSQKTKESMESPEIEYNPFLHAKPTKNVEPKSESPKCNPKIDSSSAVLYRLERMERQIRNPKTGNDKARKGNTGMGKTGTEKTGTDKSGTGKSGAGDTPNSIAKMAKDRIREWAAKTEVPISPALMKELERGVYRTAVVELYARQNGTLCVPISHLTTSFYWSLCAMFPLLGLIIFVLQIADVVEDKEEWYVGVVSVTDALMWLAGGILLGLTAREVWTPEGQALRYMLKGYERIFDTDRLLDLVGIQRVHLMLAAERTRISTWLSDGHCYVGRPSGPVQDSKAGMSVREENCAIIVNIEEFADHKDILRRMRDMSPYWVVTPSGSGPLKGAGLVRNVDEWFEFSSVQSEALMVLDSRVGWTKVVNIA